MSATNATSNATTQVKTAPKKKTTKIALSIRLQKKNKALERELAKLKQEFQVKLETERETLKLTAQKLLEAQEQLQTTLEKNSQLEAEKLELEEDKAELENQIVGLEEQLVEAKKAKKAPRKARATRAKLTDDSGEFRVGMYVMVKRHGKEDCIARIEKCNKKQAKLYVFRDGKYRAERKNEDGKVVEKQEEYYKKLTICPDQDAAEARFETIGDEKKAERVAAIAAKDTGAMEKCLRDWSMKNRYEYLNNSDEIDRTSAFSGELRYYFKYFHNIGSRQGTMGHEEYARIMAEKEQCRLGKMDKRDIVLDAIEKMKKITKKKQALLREAQKKYQPTAEEAEAALAITPHPSEEEEEEFDALAVFTSDDEEEC